MSSTKHTRLFLREWMVNLWLFVQWILVEIRNFLTRYATWNEPIPWIPCPSYLYFWNWDAMFRTQIHALLRASVHGQLRIMFLMVVLLKEFRAAKAVYEEEKQTFLLKVLQLRMISKLVSWLKSLQQRCLQTNLQKSRLHVNLEQTTWSNTQWQQTVWTSKFHTFTNHITHQPSLDQQRYRRQLTLKVNGQVCVVRWLVTKSCSTSCRNGNLDEFLYVSNISPLRNT